LPPVALDLQLSLFFKYPWQRGEVVVGSGDVVLDFDTQALPEDRGHICGFAKAAPAEQATYHGVFRFDRHRERVQDYFQKAPVSHLIEQATLEGSSDCALDIGLVALSPEAATALVGFGDDAFESGTVLDALARGALRFDLYVELLTAALSGMTSDAFLDRIAGQSTMPRAAAQRLFARFQAFPLRAVVTRATTFIHLGTLDEFPQACREVVQRELRPFYDEEPGELRPVVARDRLLVNSAGVEVTVPPSGFAVFEGCRDVRIDGAAGDTVFIGLDGGHLAALVPDAFCVDQRRLGEESFLLVYSARDTFRRQRVPDDVIFCGVPLPRWLDERGLSASDVRRGESADLLDMALFCAGQSLEFAAGYWTAPGPTWRQTFKAARRISLREANEADSPVIRDDRRRIIRVGLLRESILRQQGWNGASAADFKEAFDGAADGARLREIYRGTDDDLLRVYRRASLHALPGAKPTEREPEIRVEFVDRGALAPPPGARVKLDQIVWARSPVRLDLAGGWTDTPPYTLRHGGQVVNVAVDLNGQPPIQVFCRRTTEPHVRIHSVDLGVGETVTDRSALTAYGDPSAPFALPKAALDLVGLAQGTEPLAERLERMGGGLELTLLCAVPKGSGLGTSSILGGTILAALHRFFGLQVPPSELFRQVLQMEQMLTTGGGWQDQIGGLVGGVKYVETRPGLKPNPLIYPIDPTLFEDRRTAPCFTLFYTGQTRLAKNILVDVVDRVNARSTAYLFTLRHMKELATRARDAIALRSIPAVAEVLSQSWSANKRIHASTSNPDMEHLLERTRPYCLGAKLLGAGGGGYALFLSATLEDADRLRQRLAVEFENERARLVDFRISIGGLEVSVS
jgi:galactokinase/mevalonate kinase-like predicted kinase